MEGMEDMLKEKSREKRNNGRKGLRAIYKCLFPVQLNPVDKTWREMEDEMLGLRLGEKQAREMKTILYSFLSSSWQCMENTADEWREWKERLKEKKWGKKAIMEVSISC